MSKSPSQKKIESLTEHLENEKLARTIDQQRHQQELQREALFRTSIWNDLLKDFPQLKYLVDVCRQYRDAADPRRGAPTVDTARVSHPELTSVEAAADWNTAKERTAGSKAAERSRIEWANQEIERLAGKLDDRLRGSQEKKIQDPRPRCRRRSCKGENKSLPMGSTICPVCHEPLPQAA